MGEKRALLKNFMLLIFLLILLRNNRATTLTETPLNDTPATRPVPAKQLVITSVALQQVQVLFHLKLINNSEIVILYESKIWY